MSCELRCDKEKVQTNRNVMIDTVKGVLIILVVLGNAIKWACAEGTKPIIFHVIYSFHMPLVMAISGYVLGFTKKQMDLQWLKNRFVSLVIPFISWIFISYLCNREWNEWSIWQKLRAIAYSPDNGGYWFLWVLFLNCCGLAVLAWSAKKLSVTEGKLFAVVVILCILVPLPIVTFKGHEIFLGMLGIGLCKWHFPSFGLGYILAKCKKKMQFRDAVICIIAFGVLFNFYEWNVRPVFIDNIASEWTGTLALLVLEWLYVIYKYAIALTASGCVVYCVYKLPFVKLKNALAFVGKYTLEIYILHILLGNLLEGNIGESYVKVLVGTFVLITVSIRLSMLLEKSRLLALCLFGKQVSIKL